MSSLESFLGSDIGTALIKIERFTDIRFPEQCQLHQPVTLTVQLTVQPVEPDPDASPTEPKSRSPKRMYLEASPVEAQKEQIKILVCIMSDGFRTDQRWGELTLPLHGNSQKIAFELTGIKLGQQIVEVEFYHQASRCGYVIVGTTVVDSETSGQDAQEFVQPLIVSVHPNPEAHIVATYREDTLDYWVINEFGRMSDGGSQAIPESSQPDAAFGADLAKILSDAILLADEPDQIDAIWFQLQSLGVLLRDQFLTPQLQQISAQWPAGSIVTIGSNFHWLPWELIYDGNTFWGQKFIIARLPKTSGVNAFNPSAASIQPAQTAAVQKVSNIIGGKVGSGNLIKRIKLMFEECESCAKVLVIENSSVPQIPPALTGSDIIHFTCHGYTTPKPYLQIGFDDSPASALTPIGIRNLPIAQGSIVFINSCTSAVTSQYLGDLRSFTW